MSWIIWLWQHTPTFLQFVLILLGGYIVLHHLVETSAIASATERFMYAAESIEKMMSEFMSLADETSSNTRDEESTVLEDEVLLALCKDPVTKECAINIEEIDPGVIELTGNVSDPLQHARAQAIVNEVLGVIGCINRLELIEGDSNENPSPVSSLPE